LDLFFREFLVSIKLIRDAFSMQRSGMQKV
jgi:hypothetical protein